jgi:hypothetical protein
VSWTIACIVAVRLAVGPDLVAFGAFMLVPP